MPTRPTTLRLVFAASAIVGLAACSSNHSTAPEPAGSAPLTSVTAAPLASLGPPPTVPATPAAPPTPAAPSVDVTGHWTLTSSGGRCNLVLAAPVGGAGTVAAEADCPGRFSRSRGWRFDPGGAVVLTDATGAPIAHLPPDGYGHFIGQSGDGMPVSLER